MQIHSSGCPDKYDNYCCNHCLKIECSIIVSHDDWLVTCELSPTYSHKRIFHNKLFKHRLLKTLLIMSKCVPFVHGSVKLLLAQKHRMIYG